MNTAPAGEEYQNGVGNYGMNGGPRVGVENYANQGNMPHDAGASDHDSITIVIDNPGGIPVKARTQMDQLQRTENLDPSSRDNNAGTSEASSGDHYAIGGIAENGTCSGGRLMTSEGHHIAQGESNDITDAVSRTIAVHLLEANESYANAKLTSEVEAKKSGGNKTNITKSTRPSTVSIHGNQFQDCNIFIGENTRRKDCTGNTNKKEIHLDNSKNISGSFEMSESDIGSMTNLGYSSGIGNSPTLKQPDRRAVNPDKENDEAGNVNNEPPCRPELIDGACGGDMDNTAAPRREVKFNSKDVTIEMKCSGSVTEQGLNGIDDGLKVTGETKRPENAPKRGRQHSRVLFVLNT